jgi:4'-phosphopantetheinyl transferase
MTPPRLTAWNPADPITPLNTGETRVWSVELDQPAHDPETMAFEANTPPFASLSPDEVARATRFVRPRDRLRFARCRVALRHILGRLLALAPDSIAFRPIASGKPELDPVTTPNFPATAITLRFNVSHSANLGLIAVCLGRELGVDIERVRPITEADRIVASYFTASEQATFATFPADTKDLAFHRGWTRKEAIIKAEGTGLAGLATSFETHFGAAEPPRYFQPTQPFHHVNRWMLWEVTPAPGFVAALALASSPLPS